MKIFVYLLFLMLFSCSSEPQKQNNEAARTILIQRKEKLESHIKEMRDRNPKAVIPPFYIKELKHINSQIKSLE